jgi:hypothetical protein
MIDAQPNCENGEDVKNDDSEERGFDSSGDGFVRFRRLPSGDGDQFNAAKGVECEDEGLGEGGEAADERLTVVEIRETLVHKKGALFSGVDVCGRVGLTGPG